MRVLVYGGSFDPPHLGHAHALRRAAEYLRPDRVLLVPCARPPHKPLPEGVPTAEERLSLVRRMAEELPGAEVSELDMRREGPAYTSLLLADLAREMPGAELIFLMGTDMLLSFETWHEPGKILSLSSLAVMTRAAGESETVLAAADRLRERYGACVTLVPSDPVEVSSTELRQLLPLRQGEELIPPAVYSEIIRCRHYGAKPRFSWLREQVDGHLKPARIPHVRGTEQEAIRLAERWGEDPGLAAEAAIVHDMTKREPLAEQLRLCQTYGIIPDDRERVSEKLLHAKTGAALAKALFGLPEAAVSAVRWHTTGRAGMTRLEQILYLADYIEPTRSGFDGLEELRVLAYRNLDEAMLLGLRLSLAEIRARGEEPHEDSLQAEAYFASRVKGTI